MDIIIVDDEPVCLAVMKDLVSRLPDCRARDFMEPAAALAWCRTNTVDLVIVDYVMPEIDGIEFTRRLRAMPGRGETPVVMVSVRTEREVIRSALQNGVDDFLNKPFDFVDLQTCVSNMLGLRATREQLANRAMLLDAAEESALPQSAPQSPHGLLDRNMSRARLAGDEKLLGKVASIFLFTVPHVLSAIRTALADHDMETVLMEVTALKGAVAALEAPDVLHFLSRVELHAKNNDLVATVAAFSMAQALVDRLLRELAPLVPARATVVETEAP